MSIIGGPVVEAGGRLQRRQCLSKKRKQPTDAGGEEGVCAQRAARAKQRCDKTLRAALDGGKGWDGVQGQSACLPGGRADF